MLRERAGHVGLDDPQMSGMNHESNDVFRAPLGQNQSAGSESDASPTGLCFHCTSGDQGDDNADHSRRRVHPTFWWQRARVNNLWV